MNATETLEGQGDGEAVASTPSKPWLDLITDASQYFETYHKKCDSVEKLYANLEELSSDAGDREFQIFWANLEVLKPSIYARPPAPVVTPRHKDQKALPREASELLQRCLSTSFDVQDLNSTMLEVRDDVAVCARGVVWLRYEAEETEKGVEERVCYDHVDRKDFVHDPARKWKDVEWVARRVFMTKEEGAKRFGDTFFSATFKQADTDKGTGYKDVSKAAVWEIWHKTEKKVIWITDGLDDVLDEKPPFLSLDGFFPCPKPAYGTLQRRSLIPVPDFVYYRDQVEEINELTARISSLAEGLRLKGFYAAGQEDLKDAIERVMKDQAHTATLVPVSNMGSLGGVGMKDAIMWLPINDVATTIVSCVELRRQLIDDVYQLSGLSDIMRGATDPNETLGAQELKSQYGNVRVRDRQNELIRIARDITRMSGEIKAENFQPQTLLDMSQMEMPTDADIQGQRDQLAMQVQQLASNPQAAEMAQANPEQAQQLRQQFDQQMQQFDEAITIDKIVGLFREQRMRPFVLDIETDSTIQPDEDAEKQRRTEFVTAVGGFLNQAAPMVMQFPQSGEFVSETLKFVAAPFRAGRELEAAIDKFSDQIKQLAAQPPKPDPEMQKAEAEAKARQDEMAMKSKEHEMDLQAKTMDIEFKREENQLKREDMQSKMALTQQQRDFDAANHAAQAEDRTFDRQHKEKLATMQLQGDKAEAGVPPDYSFEEDRKLFQAITAEMTASRETQAEMMQMMMQQTQAIATGMQALAKAVSAPKQARKLPDGSRSTETRVN